MCGIAGILSFDGRPVAPARVRAMTDAIVHRGPDDEGFHFGQGVGLGMRRLAIIDLETGRQPIANEDGSVQVVLNGEIYNFRELRRRLEARGHRFATATDTEVIVHLYEERGPACVEELRGMFAFALWDAAERRLLVARDRLGIKPLYWARYRGRYGDSLAFASELKAILALDELPVELDGAAVDHLFSFSTTPADRSIVAGVAKLEPGHLLLASAGTGVAVRRWWDLRFEPDRTLSEGEWIEALRAELDESVRLHRVSDVPLGAFLSGGVDSSAVVSALARTSPDPVRTFSIGFRESDYDELEYARLAAEAFGTRHREQVVEPEVIGVLEDLAWHLDEPFGDSSAIPTFMVSQLAAGEVTVVLSGDGGDELFAGYDKYRVERRERRNRFLPAPLRRLLGAAGEALPEGATGRELLRHLALVGADRYLDAGTLFKDDQKRRLFADGAVELPAGHDPRAYARRFLDTPDTHWLSALQRLDLATYLPLDILTKVDRMSMAHSLEARVPLLDHRVVELAARIPPELQLRGERGKHLFKRALEGRVPRPILERPKRGFAIPLGHWFRGRLGGFVRELLLSEESRRRGLFRASYLERLLALHEGGRPLDLHLWTLVSFELWCRTFLDRGARAAAAPAAPVPAPPE
ncbi:MAG TPA: asparagine synthase (glutamine-hydrolyzing), partial [Thermoanaerobaculia bacterium]|nr:asparagine synthase (glutamine-hydrolyzing) [Thermoanaerobaculia bacterium]